MKKNGILTLLFAFIPGAGQMYQGYMKRGLSLVLMAAAISMAAMLIPPIAFALLVVFMYSFFDIFNLRAQISMGTAPEDDYLVHFDPQDKRLARMMMDSHKLVGWCLIATGALIAYEQIIMNTLGDILWRWGQKAPVWRAIYLAAGAQDRPGGRADPAGVRGAVFCRKAPALEVRLSLGAPLHRADGQRLWRGLPDGSL